MKKAEQQVINYLAENIFNMAMTEYAATIKSSQYSAKKWKRLRTCQARVLETSNFYILKSFNTIVAVIEKGSDILVDMLRHEYGYTSRSAHQIAKFKHDYSTSLWGCETVYTYR